MSVNAKHTCGGCEYYTGGGDWNLCCQLRHPTEKEKAKGKTFPFGHLCYRDTEACDDFLAKQED